MGGNFMFEGDTYLSLVTAVSSDRGFTWNYQGQISYDPCISTEPCRDDGIATASNFEGPNEVDMIRNTFDDSLTMVYRIGDPMAYRITKSFDEGKTWTRHRALPG